MNDSAAHSARCVVVKLDDHGVVMPLRQMTSTSVFGFDPALLVSHPLTAFVITFKRYADKHGEAALHHLLASAVDK